MLDQKQAYGAYVTHNAIQLLRDITGRKFIRLHAASSGATKGVTLLNINRHNVQCVPAQARYIYFYICE